MAVDVEPGAPTSGVDDDAPRAGTPAPPPSRQTWLSKRVVVGVAALAVLGGVLAFTGGSENEDAGDVPAGEDTEAPTDQPELSGELAEGAVVFSDLETGMSLQHPESWVPLKRPEGSLRLLLGAGGKNSLLVRYNRNDLPINSVEDLEKIQETTDRIAGTEEVQVLERKALTVNELPAIYYLSRFTDQESGEKGVNEQIFVFQGTNMYILLFQYFPESEFDKLAPQARAVLETFQVTAEPTPPAEEGEPAEAPAEPAG